VLGHPRVDESTLSAADVAVAMPGAGATPGEWGVMLASDDVRDGALAISLARRTKHDARVSLILALAPGVVAAVAVAFGLLAPPWAPIAALVGAFASGVHARASDLGRAGVILPTPKARPSIS
jgi:Cu+-exporting ATPase